MYKNNYLFATIIFCIFSLLAFSPPVDRYNLIGKIDTKNSVRYFTTDFLKSAYLINNRNQLVKIDSSGAQTAVFNENGHGELSFVDATSPFNILLLYRDFGHVILTDIKLGKRQYFNLPNIGIQQISTACLAHDNYIWVYDMGDARLKKINGQHEVIYKSFNLKNLLGDDTIEPNFVIERDGFLYLNIPSMGIVIFDVYGTFVSAVSNSDMGVVGGLDHFQILNGRVIFYYDGFLNIFNPFTGEMQLSRIPSDNNTLDIAVQKNRLYVLNKKALNFYTRVQ